MLQPWMHLLHLSVAVAPMYSQQIAWRSLDSGASSFLAPVGLTNIFGAAAMVKPSLPSTACFPSAEADRTNQDEEALDFDAWPLPSPI